MATDIIVNAAAPRTRVAILEDGKLVELLLESEERVVGNIYLGRVENVVRALDAAFVNCGIERNVFLHVSDALEVEPTREQMRHKMEAFPPITEVVKEGDEFLVQVTKGPVNEKGARATRRLALPARHLVLLADGRGRIGVSKKIENEAERARLRALAAKVKPEGFGLIVRTRAEGAEKKDFEADIKFLLKLWRSIQAKARQEKAPALIYEDLSLVFEVLRDIFDPKVRSFVVDDKATYDKVLNLLHTLAPELRSRVKLYRGEEPIFVHYNIEAEIEKALRRKIWLPHGGYITIDTTEALTAIDVNTGKFTANKSLEETVLRTNIEAAQEIARQLRLRDIGGIIVIDFIDMENPEHRQQVMTTFREALESDRMRTRIMHITRLGLVEMTRKRTGEGLSQLLQAPCPHCDGTGRVPSPEAMFFRIAEALRKTAQENPDKAILVKASPAVILLLVGSLGTAATQMEERLQRHLYFRVEKDIEPDEFILLADNERRLRRQCAQFRKGQKITLQAEDIFSRGVEQGLTAIHKGFVIEAPEAPNDIEAPVSVRFIEVGRSHAVATVLGTR